MPTLTPEEQKVFDFIHARLEPDEGQGPPSTLEVTHGVVVPIAYERSAKELERRGILRSVAPLGNQPGPRRYLLAD